MNPFCTGGFPVAENLAASDLVPGIQEFFNLLNFNRN
jgi:hypothetical protein